uniref:MH2 domain-containing protein n=1 Tax=Meloidogyne enterolobii TaxID=390850 RepID=A0A6V7W7Z1_MELEN|nr:unnamed protein product [Meloidogyne enterolobii]
MSGKQPPKQSFHPIKNEIIESEPIPGTSSTNLQNLTDLRIRNSLNTILIQPNNQDVLASSQMRPPKSDLTNFWCLVYYYEMNERVGEVFKSEWKQELNENPQLIIDGGVCASAENTRFCLGVIGNINRNPFVTKVGRSIGKGIRLNQKDENIYLESLSDSAVFVQCPLFARKNGDELATVYRLKASDASTSSSNGSKPFCLFDMKMFDTLLTEARLLGYNALYMLQIYCLCRISFVKGWGQEYRRQTITSCPMWIEVQFPRPLQILDEVLMENADEIGGEEVHSFS